MNRAIKNEKYANVTKSDLELFKSFCLLNPNLITGSIYESTSIIAIKVCMYELRSVIPHSSKT